MKKETLEVLIQQHQGTVYRYLKYLGADPDEADDMLQETFLTAYSSKNFPMDGNPTIEAAWLRGTARNLLYQLFRKNKQLRDAASAQSIAAREEVWTDEFVQEDQGFKYIEALQTCLEQLPPKQTEALDLRYKKKTSREEMAHILEMTGDGVKSLLRRIRTALRNCIESRLTPAGDR